MKKRLFQATLVPSDDTGNTAIDMVPIDRKTLWERDEIAYKSLDVILVKVDYDLIYKVYWMHSELGGTSTANILQACKDIEESIVEDELERKGELK